MAKAPAAEAAPAVPPGDGERLALVPRIREWEAAGAAMLAEAESVGGADAPRADSVRGRIGSAATLMIQIAVRQI